MAELDTLQDVPLFGPFSPEAIDYVKTLKEDPLFASIQEKAPKYITFSITCARTILERGSFLV
jgi:hypothetical protein